MKTIEQKLENLGFENVSMKSENINTVYQKGKRWINLSTERTGLINENTADTNYRSYLAPMYIQKLFV